MEIDPTKYSEYSTVEEGRKAKEYILEILVQVIGIERSQHAIKVRPPVFSHVIITLHHESAVNGVENRLILLGSHNGSHPILS